MLRGWPAQSKSQPLCGLVGREAWRPFRPSPALSDRLRRERDAGRPEPAHTGPIPSLAVKTEGGNAMTGKVAFVSGGAGGLGAAICRRFVREGAAVAIADIDRGRAEALTTEISSSGGRSLPVTLDSASGTSVQQAVDEVVDHFGRCDFLIHGAGNTAIAPLPRAGRGGLALGPRHPSHRRISALPGRRASARPPGRGRARGIDFVGWGNGDGAGSRRL